MGYNYTEREKAVRRAHYKVMRASMTPEENEAYLARKRESRQNNLHATRERDKIAARARRAAKRETA